VQLSTKVLDFIVPDRLFYQRWYALSDISVVVYLPSKSLSLSSYKWCR